MSLIGLSGAVCASRSVFSLGSQKPESTILSGSNRRFSRNSARRIPDAASTTRPSTSDAMLYSHTVPGWWARGALASPSISSAGVRPRASYDNPVGWNTPTFAYASLTGVFTVISP